MKIRTCYVSNSSSASFVIHGFAHLSEQLKRWILEYDEYCYKYCKAHDIPLIDSGEPSSDVYDPHNCDGKCWVDGREDGFGYLNDGCRYRFTASGSDMVATTVMANFDLGSWLEALGVNFIGGLD